MTSSARPRLHGGRPLPDEILRGLSRFGALPTEARLELPALLLPSLDPKPAPELEARASAFAERFAVPLATLASVIGGFRFVLRGAALHGLSAEDLREDLQTAAASSDGFLEAVVAIYPTARARIASAALEDSIRAMGPVLVGLDWRLDVVAGSKGAPGVRGPVLQLALDVSDAGRTETLRFQVPPAMIDALRAMCEAIRPR